MEKYKTIPDFVDAMRWDADNPHPDVKTYDNFRSGDYHCSKCNLKFKDHQHGQIYTNLGNKTVCPGDWIASDAGGFRVIPNDKFLATYEPA